MLNPHPIETVRLVLRKPGAQEKPEYGGMHVWRHPGPEALT